MKKILLFLVVMCLYCMALSAEPVTKQKAQQIAAQWLAEKSPTRRALPVSEMKAEVVLDAVNGVGQPYLYAVHAKDRNGFVIVSGAVLYELDVVDKAEYGNVTGYDVESGLVTLNFKSAHIIEPGKPYFLEWETTTSSEIVNPVFDNVTIKTTPAAEGIYIQNGKKIVIK